MQTTFVHAPLGAGTAVLGGVRHGRLAPRRGRGVVRRVRGQAHMSAVPPGPEDDAISGALAEDLSPKERELAARLAEQERLRAAEKFVQVDEGNYGCINCGYLYEVAQGERLAGVAAGTEFGDVPSSFSCPVCKSPKRLFQKKTKTIAGFAENQQYGFGTNSMTPGQKNLMIFGSLAFFFLLLLSGYALD